MNEYWLKLLAGLVAYVVAFLTAAGPLLYASHLSSLFSEGRLRRKRSKVPVAAGPGEGGEPDPGSAEEVQVSMGNRSIAIRMGARMLCQAILIRHAVFATVAVVRSLFVYQYPFAESLELIARSLALIIVINILAMLSVFWAEATLKAFTSKINEDEEIQKGNVAVAIFVALALLAITLVLDPGMKDFAEAFIPLGRAGLN